LKKLREFKISKLIIELMYKAWTVKWTKRKWHFEITVVRFDSLRVRNFFDILRFDWSNKNNTCTTTIQLVYIAYDIWVFNNIIVSFVFHKNFIYTNVLALFRHARDAVPRCFNYSVWTVSAQQIKMITLARFSPTNVYRRQNTKIRKIRGRHKNNKKNSANSRNFLSRVHIIRHFFITYVREKYDSQLVVETTCVRGTKIFITKA